MPIIKQHKREDTIEHSAGQQIEFTTGSQKLKSHWYIRNAVLTHKMKQSPGIPLFDSDDNLKGHLHLTPAGEYEFYSYSKPKNHIMHVTGKLSFYKEVRTINQAQEIIDAYRAMNMAAACTHKNGLHQVYINLNKK